MKILTKYSQVVLSILPILFFLFSTNRVHAGGSCSFSDNCGSATNFTFCSPVSASNENCTTSDICDASTDNASTCGCPVDFVFDECDRALCNEGCVVDGSGSYTDASGECNATVTVNMAGLASCTQNDPLCGTVENTSYSRICIPATYVGSCAPTFSVTGISCAGGGASLQWVLYPSTTTCANMLTSNPDGAGSIIPCENGRTTNYSATPTMTAGSCYILMFDGNAKAVCSWTFNMTAPTPVASFTSSASTACTVAPNNCVTFTNTSTCYNTANVTWTATGLANQTTDDATFCWTTSGSKTVTLTVGSGMGACTGTATANTTITVSVCCTPPTISLVSKTNVTCPGGTNGAIDISVSGGTAPYTYAWSNGGSTQDLTSLAAGNYTVTVTETGGCTATYTNSITAPAAWSVTNTTTNVLCPCASTGAVNITVSGATSPYTYLWSNSASVEDITSVVAGTYTVTITDSKSCTTTRSYAITEPAQISIALNSQTNVACFSQCNGSVTIQASGGTSPYDYSNNGGAAWQFNDQAAVTYSGLCAGSYTYTVRDANGCLTH